MGDKPILFSTPMVLALLRELQAPGTGKTQTRRLLAHSVEYTELLASETMEDMELRGWCSFEDTDGNPFMAKPPIARGDRLWVKERLAKGSTDQGIEFATYVADHQKPWWAGEGWQWKRNTLPSIHMPRVYSRLTLTVTDVRVQRLHEIDEADALAEGIVRYGRFYSLQGADWDDADTSAVAAYERLWRSINGLDAWSPNPWVAAYTFTVEARS